MSPGDLQTIAVSGSGMGHMLGLNNLSGAPGRCQQTLGTELASD